jgi:Tfp pilus assembly protein PilX
MEANRMKTPLRRQRGIALPVMMIILLVMLVSSVYLFKASNSTTMTTANLAYDASLSKAADLGLHAGFQWLSDTATANKGLLNADDSTHAYLANLDVTLAPSASNFWVGSIFITDSANNRIEYVVHRMCAVGGAYDAAGNTCVQTAANTSTLGSSVAIGDSLAADSPSFAGTPQVHYVITARIFGPRGGNVMNQLVVLIGA